jgi:hypothetical protein
MQVPLTQYWLAMAKYGMMSLQFKVILAIVDTAVGCYQRTIGSHCNGFWTEGFVENL